MKIFTYSFNNMKLQSKPSKFDQGVRNIQILLAVGLIAVIVYAGISRVYAWCQPYLFPTGSLIILLSFLGMLLVSKVKPIRPFLSRFLYVMAALLAACAWVYALLFVIKNLGLVGIFFCVFLQILTPIAIIGAVWKGAWSVVGTLLLFLIFSFIIKMASLRLDTGIAQPAKNDNVIDVAARPVE